MERPDDKPEVIKERLRIYYEQTKPVEDFYRDKKALIDIDASGNPESVLKNLEEIVQKNAPNLAPAQQ